MSLASKEVGSHKSFVACSRTFSAPPFPRATRSMLVMRVTMPCAATPIICTGAHRKKMLTTRWPMAERVSGNTQSRSMGKKVRANGNVGIPTQLRLVLVMQESRSHPNTARRSERPTEERNAAPTRRETSIRCGERSVSDVHRTTIHFMQLSRHSERVNHPATFAPM